jgi:hypothetical protein
MDPLKMVSKRPKHVGANFKYFSVRFECFNHLYAQLNPICHLLVSLGAHHILHISGISVKV